MIPPRLGILIAALCGTLAAPDTSIARRRQGTRGAH